MRRTLYELLVSLAILDGSTEAHRARHCELCSVDLAIVGALASIPIFWRVAQQVQAGHLKGAGALFTEMSLRQDRAPAGSALHSIPAAVHLWPIQRKGLHGLLPGPLDARQASAYPSPRHPVGLPDSCRGHCLHDGKGKRQSSPVLLMACPKDIKCTMHCSAVQQGILLPL